MSEDHVDHTMMAELAKLWEEDHDVASLGDEQTWDQDEWFLDPATLMAAHRETLSTHHHPCCQALKRRKLPPEIQPALNPSAMQPTDSSADALSSIQTHSVQQTGPMPTTAPTPAPNMNCCSFQMPHIHLPSGLISTPQGNPYSMMPGMIPPMQNPHLPGMWPPQGNHTQSQNHALLAALQHQLALPDLQAASAAMLSTQLNQPITSPETASTAAPQLAPATSTRASGLPPRSSSQAQASLSLSQPQLTAPLPAAVAAAKAPVPPRTALPSAHRSSTTNAVLPGGIAESEAGSDSDGEGAGGANAGLGGGTAMSASTSVTGAMGTGAVPGGAGRGRGAALQPATYTGSLDDVVALSDQCPDEASRMMCQVAGCGKDLSGFKEYHQRYRICDVHIKLPQVLKDGRLQRFCQQCGRFHDLAAFDANRKSCREQLNKHNARRRRRAQIEAQKSKAIEQLSGAAGLVSVLAAPGAPGGGGGGNGGNNGLGNEPADALGSAAVPNMVAAAGDTASDVGRFLSALMQNPTHLHALRLLLGVQTHPALPPLQPFVPDIAASPTPQPAGSNGGLAGTPGDMGVAGSPASMPPEPPSYGLARDIVDCKGPWSAGFESDHRALRISMKLFNRTPADLPMDLRQQVTGWLATMPTALAGAIRPGCVFLTLHLLLSRTAYANAIKRGLSSLLTHLRTRTGCPLWHEGAYVVQMGWEMALVAGGRVTAYYHDPSGPAPAHPVALEAVTPSSHAEMALGAPPRPPRQYPVVSDIAPLCVCVPKPAHRGTTAPVTTMLQLALRGSCLAAPGAELVVRQQGTQLRLPLSAAPDGLSATASIPFLRDAGDVSAPASTTAATSPHGALTSCGMVWVEVARGAWMSPARPLLLLDDPTLVNEVSELLQANCRAELSIEERDALLVDLGMVLAHVSNNADASHHHHGHHDDHSHHDHHHAALGRVTDCFKGTDHAIVSLKARRLLLFACDMGWAGVAARVLPLATGACACAAEVVAAVHASSAPPTATTAALNSTREQAKKQQKSGGGLSLLHRVVRSGNLALLQGVLHWGAVAGYAWRADRNGPGGVTPLHLAALQEDPRILLALLDYAPPSAFTCLQAQDGTTPFHLAFQMGHFSLNQLTDLLVDEKLLPSDRMSSALAAAARNKASSTPPTTHAGVSGVGARGEVITAAGPQGREVDPCTKCHCRLPPLLLSIAAACATCGSRVPCLGALPAHADGHGHEADVGADAGGHVPGHDAARCAGCTTEQQQRTATVGGGAGGQLVGRKRPLSELSAPALTVRELAAGQWSMGADCANNCAGVTGPEPVADVCAHHTGSVFSITAMCQGCHTNRVLEVM